MDTTPLGLPPPWVFFVIRYPGLCQPWAQFRKTIGLETEGSGGQAFIAVTQDEYDKQVKSGKLNHEQARETKNLLKQFHGELTGFIVRQALTKVALRLLKMRKKERLNKRDKEDLLGCAEEITQVGSS